MKKVIGLTKKSIMTKRVKIRLEFLQLEPAPQKKDLLTIIKPGQLCWEKNYQEQLIKMLKLLTQEWQDLELSTTILH